MNRVMEKMLMAVTLMALACSCANKGFPEGGAKDVTPPVVVGERPASFTTGFREKRASIYFNEYVQLRDVNTKFIMSPPARKAARVNLRGKYILVEFQDSLREETTYSLDFGNAIVDNTEGNPLFSTGAVIDTLEVGGKVEDAVTGLPLLGMNVMLYGPGHADSAALKVLPDYVARTDSSGMFRVTNVREVAYRVMVVDDGNRDNLFTPGEEKVCFLDSVVTPVTWRETRLDTIRADTGQLLVKHARGGRVSVSVVERDTVVEREHVVYGPANLRLVMFEEERSRLYLTGERREERERLEFTFSVPRDNRLRV